jgi:hypothetical protein
MTWLREQDHGGHDDRRHDQLKVADVQRREHRHPTQATVRSQPRIDLAGLSVRSMNEPAEPRLDRPLAAPQTTHTESSSCGPRAVAYAPSDKWCSRNRLLVSTQMSIQLWVGFGFLSLLVLFLIVAFFTKENLSDDQRTILKLLCALCAAFAGGFISGDALFKMDLATKVFIASSAGFAAFCIVWFFFPKPPSVPPRPPDAIRFSIPKGWTFKQTVEALVERENAVAKFVNFTPAELQTLLRERELEFTSVREALGAMRLLASNGEIREYDVNFQPPTFLLQVRLTETADAGKQERL